MVPLKIVRKLQSLSLIGYDKITQDSSFYLNVNIDSSNKPLGQQVRQMFVYEYPYKGNMPKSAHYYIEFQTVIVCVEVELCTAIICCYCREVIKNNKQLYLSASVNRDLISMYLKWQLTWVSNVFTSCVFKMFKVYGKMA